MDTLSLMPMKQVFELAPKAKRELGRVVSDLTPAQLELLVRTDGALSLAQVREAMPALSDDSFTAAFQAMWRQGLLREAQKEDMFSTTTRFQLQVMGMALGEPAQRSGTAGGREGFSMGLVWRRPLQAANDPRRPLRAVVVEDDPVLARFIQCFLGLEGFEVRMAANRAEVVEGFRTPEAPDLVLLDVMLPDADGFDVLRRLRLHPRLQHVPVIMLTGCATREGVLQALACGANGYLTKPFDADLLARAARAVTGLPDPMGAGEPLWGNGDALPERAVRRAVA
jgi:CheY-like chemotaxis protein